MTTQKSRVAYTHATVASPDGVVSFNVTARFTPIDGDLPDGVFGVFLMRVGAPLDPKSDVFVRVAVLGDLGVAATSRDIALDPASYQPAAQNYITSSAAPPTGYYLTPDLTLGFDRLDVAIQAKAVLEQRIDSLITDWQTYRDALYGATLQEFPLPSSALVAAAKSKYYAAAAALSAAESALTTATTAYNAAMATADTLRTELARIEALKPLVCGASSYLSQFSSAYDTYFSSSGGRQKLRDAVSDNTTRESEAALYDTLFHSKISAFDSALSQAADACQMLGSQSSLVGQALATAQQAATDAAIQKNIQTGLRDEAQTSRDTAYNAVRDVCPSFVP